MTRTDLTAQELRERLHYDPQTGTFTRLKSGGGMRAGSIAGYQGAHGYIAIWISGSLRLAHRLAWLYIHGQWPTNTIDHIDGNRANNAISNLREASNEEQHQNIRLALKTSRTGLLGVQKTKNRYMARIMLNRKRHFLGTFSTPEEAHSAYVTAKRRLHPFGTI